MKSLAREQKSKHGFMYKSKEVTKACLEQGSGNFEQGGERSKEAHFSCMQERLGLACLGGERELGVARVEAKSHSLHILEAWLKWLWLVVTMCA